MRVDFELFEIVHDGLHGIGAGEGSFVINPVEQKEVAAVLLAIDRWDIVVADGVNIKSPRAVLCNVEPAYPGVSSSSWVKFLPFSGKLFTSRRITAVPSSAVENSTRTGAACTVTLCRVEPTARVKS